MRNKCKLEVFLLVLSTIFALPTYSKSIFNNTQLNNEFSVEFRNEYNLKPPKSSGYWSINYIHIDDNWTDTTSYDWCSGNGSWNNPYTIENVTIDASSSPNGNGILINNSKNEYFIIKNCSVFNAQYGINLENTDNSTLTYNNCSNNNARGIMLFSNCKNNTISNNIANENSGVGIWLQNQCDNNTIKSNIVKNQNRGIRLITGCDDNIISGNDASVNGDCGIFLNNQCHNNTISANTANDNSQWGIYLENQCNNNSISGNTASNNITSNQDRGIYLENQCTDNTISANTVKNNIEYGLFLNLNADYNIISDNIVSNNGMTGIFLIMNCNDNSIKGNIINDHSQNGIYLWEQCNFNTILENIIYQNNLGIYFVPSCNDNLIYYNCICYNSVNNAQDDGTNYWDNGIFGNYWSDYIGIDTNLDGIGDSAYNIPGGGGRTDNRPLMNYEPIFLEIPEDMNYEIGTIGNLLKWTILDISPFIESYNISRNGLSIQSGTLNEIQSEIIINIEGLDEATYIFTLEIHDGYGVPNWDNVWVTVSNIAPEFTVIPDDFSYEVGEAGNNLSWTFSDVSTNNPTYTFIRDGVPIIINEPCVSDVPIEIPIDGLDIGSYWFTLEVNDGYGGIVTDNVWITVEYTPEPPIPTILFVEIVDQLFSLENFNITFIVYNKSGQGIDSAIIQMWWNGTDVSSNIQNLGNGSYFITLEPITVEPGEDPILLEIEISAPGYQDRAFNTCLAVDPDTLKKDLGGTPDNLPLIITIIIISSITGATGVTATTLLILRKRKRAS